DAVDRRQGGLVVGDHYRLPQINALELVAIVDLHSRAADQVLKRQIAAPPQFGAQRAQPLLYHSDEAVGGLEVVDDHDPRPRLAHALRLAHQNVRVAHHRDHVADEDVIEGVV